MHQIDHFDEIIAQAIHHSEDAFGLYLKDLFGLIQYHDDMLSVLIFSGYTGCFPFSVGRILYGPNR
jgi:hypothetical protein